MDGETEQVVRAAGGDREAFGVLAERCRPWLLGLCFRLVRDHGTAEDLVQEAFLRAFRDLPQLRDPERFRPWLSAVALNACRMHLRRLQSQPAPSCDAQQAAEPNPAADTPPGLGEALARLDSADRRLLALFYADGLTHAEIGELLLLSAAAVKSRLHRSRQRLRTEMLSMMTEDQKAHMGLAEEEDWTLRTILLVEPDDSLRGALLPALRAAGYQVVMFPTGEAALQAIAERQGQLLILDKHCGEPHWTEVLMLVQVDAWSRENVPVGVFVDAGNRRDLLLAWQGGAAFCLTRPFDSADVVDLTNRLQRLWPEELRPR